MDHPSITSQYPSERVQELDLSSSATIAFVCASAFFSFLLVLVYCHCYCTEPGIGFFRCFGNKRKPASPSALLPIVLYRKEEEETTRGCVVCLSEFEEKEPVKVIPGCGHVFHPQCIDRWIVAHLSCPVCRCSEIFGKEIKRRNENEGGGVEVVVRQEEQVPVRLERSRSWCDCGDGVDHGESERRMGLRRASSF